MEKVLVKLGDFETSDIIYTYEGILDNGMVKILLPNPSYKACQDLAKVIDDQAKIVTGDILEIDQRYGILVGNPKVQAKLKYSKALRQFIPIRDNGIGNVVDSLLTNFRFIMSIK